MATPASAGKIEKQVPVNLTSCFQHTMSQQGFPTPHVCFPKSPTPGTVAFLSFCPAVQTSAPSGDGYTLPFFLTTGSLLAGRRQVAA